MHVYIYIRFYFIYYILYMTYYILYFITYFIYYIYYMIYIYICILYNILYLVYFIYYILHIILYLLYTIYCNFYYQLYICICNNNIHIIYTYSWLWVGNICDGNDFGLDDHDFAVFRQSIMGCFGLPPNLMASKSCGLNGLDYGNCRQVRLGDSSYCLGVVESTC